MMPTPSPRIPDWAHAWYRVWLVVVPARERHAIGDDMTAAFAVSLAEAARRGGRWGVVTGLARSAWDLVTFSVDTRRANRRERRNPQLSPSPRPESFMDTLIAFIATSWQDLRYAARVLVKDRAFALTSLVTLAICIGANAAILSIVRSVVLKPLPVPHADRIVMFHNNYPKAGATLGSTGVPDYYDRLAQMDVFEEQALYRREGATFGAKDGARRIATLRGTPSFFRLVSAQPVLGRIFTEAEGEDGKDHEVILSYGFWQKEFGGARDVVGQTTHLSGEPYTIVGVLPAGFKYLDDDIDIYGPASFTAKQKSDDSRHSNNWNMIAMLKPGVAIERAKAEVDAINFRNDQRFPKFHQVLLDAGFYTAVTHLQDDVVQDVRAVLLLLWGGVLFVLLIGCLNIANLVLVRASGRTRELATRLAVGGSVGRLARQLLTETTLLAVIGAAIGLGLGWLALGLVPVLGLDGMPRGHDIALDPWSVGVIFSLAVASGLLFGAMPLTKLSRLDVNAALREEGRGGTSSRSTNLLRRGLATAQVTIAFVLLIGAGLLAVSFRKALHLDPGFLPKGVVTGALSLPRADYPEKEILPFSIRLLTMARALPGIEAAGLTTTVPLGGDHNDSVMLAEGYQMKPGESLISPNIIYASDGYLEAMGTRLIRGRLFTADDGPNHPLVTVVDERLARHFWPGQDPIGHRMYQPGSADNLFKTGPDTKWITVVGVVQEVQFDGVATSVEPVGSIYLSFAQWPTSRFNVVVKSRLDEASTVGSVRKVVAGINPTLPFFAVKSMDEYLDRALLPRRVPMLLASAFAAVALLLSAVGIYGVLAYGVAQRRREIGIRLALGSTGMEVFGLILREGALIVVVGLALGFGGLIALRSALTAVLFGVTPLDVTVLLSVTAALVVVAFLAMVIPARRASRVSPATALV
jgi:predicted permease